METWIPICLSREGPLGKASQKSHQGRRGFPVAGSPPPPSLLLWVIGTFPPGPVGRGVVLHQHAWEMYPRPDICLRSRPSLLGESRPQCCFSLESEQMDLSACMLDVLFVCLSLVQEQICKRRCLPSLGGWFQRDLGDGKRAWGRGMIGKAMGFLLLC